MKELDWLKDNAYAQKDKISIEMECVIHAKELDADTVRRMTKTYAMNVLINKILIFGEVSVCAPIIRKFSLI